MKHISIDKNRRDERSIHSTHIRRRGRRFSQLLAKLIGCAALVATALFAIQTPAMAFDGRTGDVVTIAADEVVEDDLYVGAQVLVIEGVVKGDVFFGVTEAIINGTVEGDLNGGAQTVTIRGSVDDVRVGLTSLTLSESSDIQGDLLMGGFNLDAQSGSKIGGDVYLGAGQARLAGSIAKDVMAAVNGLEILGIIDGDVNATVGVQGESMPFDPSVFMPDAPAFPQIPGGLTIGESAAIRGELNYSSSQPSDVPDVAERGTNFELDGDAQLTVAEPTVASRIWQVARRVIALVLMGLFLAWLLRRPILRAAGKLNDDFVNTSLWGLITAVVTPFALMLGFGLLILVAVIFGAIQLGLISQSVVSLGIPTLIAIGAGFFAIWGLISKVIVGYWLGNKMFSNNASIWMPLLVGLVIIAILSSIPYLGILVNIVVAILGLGATWLVLRDRGNPEDEPTLTYSQPEPAV